MTLRIGTVDEAVAAGRRRRFEEGSFRGIADYLFESLPGEPLGPQALIARQARAWVLPVHFHMQHQFQVVLRGHGTLGKHKITPGSVHYTSPQSAYGPIIAGSDGLDYFTLRVLTDKGAWYMPDSRRFMQIGIFKEQKTCAAIDESSAPGWTELIPRRADGLGAWCYKGENNLEQVLSEPISDAGRFYVVVRGCYSFGEHLLPAGSCAYRDSSEAETVFTSQEDDSLLIVVQFPDHAVHNHVPPELRMAPSPRGIPT